mmetsp:Transcript_21110/g.26096  ORF Transcript_21110/g.26096 Transcript_21110/m.26096 type:complete len:240 (+) Transcript_21110:820-1539(+)
MTNLCIGVISSKEVDAAMVLSASPSSSLFSSFRTLSSALVMNFFMGDSFSTVSITCCRFSFSSLISDMRVSVVTPLAVVIVSISSLNLSNSASFCFTSFTRYCKTDVFLSNALASSNFNNASRLKPLTPSTPPVLIVFPNCNIIAMSLLNLKLSLTSLHALITTKICSINSSYRFRNVNLKSIQSNLFLAFETLSIATMYFSHVHMDSKAAVLSVEESRKDLREIASSSVGRKDCSAVS